MQQPRVHVTPSPDETFGDLAAALASGYGLKPDKWQRLVLDDWLATTGGKWASLTCGLSVPRQNGKNALLEMRELFGAVGLGEKILHTAHEVKTAQKHFRRLLYFFGSRPDDPSAKFPELNALVDRIRLVNGQEAVLLKNGGSIELVARSKNSGRGFTVDLLVIDEAQETSEDALEALMPTTSAAPLGNPQWIFTGTPPGPSASGEVFTRVREEAIGDDPGSLAWHEWSPGDEYDLDDVLVWRRTNPALVAGRLQETVVAGERDRFSDAGFARERLGQWPVRGSSAAALIRPGVWSRLFDDGLPAGRRVFGIKFSVDGAYVGLAGAVAPEDGPITVSGIRLASTAEGVAWLVDWLRQRAGTTAQVVVDGKAGTAALVDALDEAGVKARAKAKPAARFIRVPTLVDYVEAHVMFLNAVLSGDLLQTGSETLAEQIGHAKKRKIGTAGGWGWQGLTDADDVTLLDAATLAFWGAKTTKRKTRWETT